jgi:hypothetical protein
MSDDKLDPTKTYVLEETVTTKSLTLEQLAKIAAPEDDEPDFDFDAALQLDQDQG